MTRSEKNISFSFFGLVFVYFTKPLWLVSDFWWHIATGRWIVQNRSLPEFDPFLFTTPMDFDLRKEGIYQGYWLAQVLYYQIYQFSGYAGILFFKAITFTLIFYIVWRYLLAKKNDVYVSLAVVAALVLLSSRYEEARPQVFSFMGAVLLYCILEKGRSEVAGGTGIAKSSLVAAPLVMMLWGNLHPGFIIGEVLLLCFAMRLMLETKDRTKYKQICFMAGAMLAGFINPNGFNGILYMARHGNLGTAEFTETINEYDVTWNYYIENNETALLCLLVALILTTAIILFWKWRKQDTFSAVLYVGLLVVGLSSFRYAFFLTLLFPLLVAEKMAMLDMVRSNRNRLISVAVVAVFSLVLVRQASASVIWGREPVKNTSIKGAVEYLKKNDVQENIFNPYEWGGYLEWELQGKYKFFVDARTLDYQVYLDYQKALSGKKQKIFDKYNINTVILYLKSITAKQMLSIHYSLFRDDHWKISYVDEYSIIFSRLSEKDQAAIIFKSNYIDKLIQNCLDDIRKNKADYKKYINIAQLYYVKNNYVDALGYFHKAAEVKPNDEFARNWIDYLQDRR